MRWRASCAPRWRRWSRACCAVRSRTRWFSWSAACADCAPLRWCWGTLRRGRGCRRGNGSGRRWRRKTRKSRADARRPPARIRNAPLSSRGIPSGQRVIVSARTTASWNANAKNLSFSVRSREKKRCTENKFAMDFENQKFDKKGELRNPIAKKKNCFALCGLEKKRTLVQLL